MKKQQNSERFLEKVCPNCNEKFKVDIIKEKYSWYNRIYCSKDCKEEVNLERANQRYRNSHSNSEWKKPRICKKCSEGYIPHHSQQKFCSKECREEYFHQVFKEKYEKISKGIIVLSNGKSCNFYKLRFEIFKRDNFTCQYCGRNVREDGIKLQADHIIPRSKGGLLVADNLITSCEECNLGKRDILLSEKKLRLLLKNQEIKGKNDK